LARLFSAGVRAEQRARLEGARSQVIECYQWLTCQSTVCEDGLLPSASLVSYLQERLQHMDGSKRAGLLKQEAGDAQLPTKSHVEPFPPALEFTLMQHMQQTYLDEQQQPSATTAHRSRPPRCTPLPSPSYVGIVPIGSSIPRPVCRTAVKHPIRVTPVSAFHVQAQADPSLIRLHNHDICPSPRAFGLPNVALAKDVSSDVIDAMQLQPFSNVDGRLHINGTAGDSLHSHLSSSDNDVYAWMGKLPGRIGRNGSGLKRVAAAYADRQLVPAAAHETPIDGRLTTQGGLTSMIPPTVRPSTAHLSSFDDLDFFKRRRLGIQLPNQ